MPLDIKDYMNSGTAEVTVSSTNLRGLGGDGILYRVVWYKTQNRRRGRTEMKTEYPAVATLFG